MMFVCGVRLQHFLTTINYFWRPYTTWGSHILLQMAICYFWRLYTSFNGYILLVALPDSDLVRIQNLLAIYRTYELKTRLKFSINLLPIIQFCFFCSSMISSIISVYPFENAVLLEILKCWKCETFFSLRYKWLARQTSKPTIYIN